MSARSAAHSWWPQHALIGWLNLVLTAPIIYLFVGLPLILRQQGWSGTEMGLLQLAGLPAVLKFALATPIDRWRKGAANYSLWTAFLGTLYALSLALLGASDLGPAAFGRLFALITLASLLGTWADVPLNALAIQLLPASERIRAGSVRSLAASLAAIVGGGLMLVLQARLGWAWPALSFALAILVSLLLLQRSGFERVASVPAAPEPSPRADLQAWLGYFHQAEHRIWAAMLLLYFPGIGAAWIYLKPLMLDQGMSQDYIAWSVGVAGGLLAALASALSAPLIRALGARTALPLFAVFNLLVIAALAAVVVGAWGPSALLAAAMALALAMGASSGLLFGLMMNHARPGLSALDYGLQSSLFVAARSLAPVLAGLLLDRLGYAGLLAGLALALSLVCLLAWHGRDHIVLHGHARPGTGG